MTAITPRKADLEAVSERSPEVNLPIPARCSTRLPGLLELTASACSAPAMTLCGLASCRAFVSVRQRVQGLRARTQCRTEGAAAAEPFPFAVRAVLPAPGAQYLKPSRKMANCLLGGPALSVENHRKDDSGTREPEDRQPVTPHRDRCDDDRDRY